MGWMKLNHYQFHSAWFIDADPGELFDALNDVMSYPLWWPEIKEVVELGDEHHMIVARSLLPYSLRFESRPGAVDRATGTLETIMTGDLEGYSRWRLASDGDGTSVIFEESVDANKKLLRRLALIGRPFFIANHSLMMHRARRGMAVYMAGWRAARSGDR
ncbi:SRPBCC family protein [soil metagenome]